MKGWAGSGVCSCLHDLVKYLRWAVQRSQNLEFVRIFGRTIQASYHNKTVTINTPVALSAER